jgi:WD40 repeat protein
MPDCALFRRASRSAEQIARIVTAREPTWTQSAIILEGHTEEVTGVALSPDSRWIVSCSNDGTARIWDASSGEPRTVLKHEARLTAATFSPDGLNVALGDENGYVLMWDTFRGPDTIGAHHEESHEVLSLAYSRDGARIVSCSATTICFMGVSSRNRLRDVRLDWLSSRSAEFVGLSSDGSRFCLRYTHGGAGHVEIWDIRDKTDLVYWADLRPIAVDSRLAFSADGQHAAFFRHYNSIEVAECLRDGSIVRSAFNMLDPQPRSGVMAVSSSARASVAFGAGNDVMLARNWSSASQDTPQPIIRLGQHTMPSTCMLFSLDGAHVISGSKDGTIGIWKTDIRHSNPLSTHASSSRATVDMTHLSRDGSRLTCGFKDGSIHVYSTTSGIVMASLTYAPETLEPVQQNIRVCLTMSPDSLRIAFFRRHTGSCLHIWRLHDSYVLACSATIPFARDLKLSRNESTGHMTWSLDGSRCAVEVAGNRIHVWDAIAGKLEADLLFPTQNFYRHQELRHIHHTEFSPDGRRLLFIVWDQNLPIIRQAIFIWSTDTWSLDSAVAFSHKGGLAPIYMPFSGLSAFSPRSTHLVTYKHEEKRLHLHSLVDDRTVANVVHGSTHTQIQEVIWSCDSSQVALMVRYEVFIWSTEWSTASGQLRMIFLFDLSSTIDTSLLSGAQWSLLSFSTDGTRLCARAYNGEWHWREGTDFESPAPDNPAQRSGPAREEASVDIVASSHSGWLLCSREDRVDLVPLLWVPPRLRW